MSVHFRKVDEDFGGSRSWNTQPNCRVLAELHRTGLPVLSEFVSSSKLKFVLSREKRVSDALCGQTTDLSVLS